MKLSVGRKQTAEWLSMRVLYLLAGLAVLMFAAFFLIGYSRPSADNPAFNEPLLTDALLVFLLLLAVAAIGVAAWAVWHSWQYRRRESAVVNGIPVRRLSLGVGSFTAVLLLLTFLFGSTAAIRINTEWYGDAFWLRVANMFVWSSLLLLCIAMTVVVFGYTRYYRDKKAERMKSVKESAARSQSSNS